MNPFEELLAKLAHADVHFVLVGGGAVMMQGYARSTQDLDIIVEASEENARRLIGVLATWGRGAGAELSVEELSEPERGAIRVIEDFPLDIFTLMRAREAQRDLSYQELAADSFQYELPDGAAFSFASIPRLLDLKAGTGRPKDQIDADALGEIARGTRERSPQQLAPPSPNATNNLNSDLGDWPI